MSRWHVDSILTREYLEERYVRLGHNSIAIAQEAGCAEKTVCLYLKRYGIPRRSGTFAVGHEWLPNAKTDTTRRLEELLTADFLRVRYVERGETADQIAQLAGCSAKTVYFHLRRHKIPCRDTRLSESHTIRRKGPPATPSWKGQTKKTNPIAAKISASKKGIPKPLMRGPNSPSWKGGLTDEARKIRNSPEYKAWREAVFNRDNFTCQRCQIRGHRLEAHHVLTFSARPDLRLAVENGITLCRSCHRSKRTLKH